MVRPIALDQESPHGWTDEWFLTGRDGRVHRIHLHLGGVLVPRHTYPFHDTWRRTDPVAHLLVKDVAPRLASELRRRIADDGAVDLVPGVSLGPDGVKVVGDQGDTPGSAWTARLDYRGHPLRWRSVLVLTAGDAEKVVPTRRLPAAVVLGGVADLPGLRDTRGPVPAG